MSKVGDFLGTESGQDALGSAISSLFGAIGGAFGNKNQRDLARENANNERELLDKKLKLAELEKETELAKINAMLNLPKKSKLPLYIGIGVGSVLVIGIVIFVAKRNR
jgi:hypothetical protein